MTVYVLQKDADKDFSPAAKFGKLAYVFGENRQVYPDNATRQAEDMVELATKKLNDFDAEKDFLLLNGDPVAIFIAGGVLGEWWDQVKVLKWDRDHKDYYEVLINLPADR